MDGYPDRLSPFDSEGANCPEPFEAWWPKVRDQFPNVPEEVARYWLHQHWFNSPFGWLKSANYSFKKKFWPIVDLQMIRCGIDNFQTGGAGCREYGESLLELDPPLRSAEYIKENGQPPASLIIMDNRDGHVNHEYSASETALIPNTYFLVEGHKRFCVCMALQGTGKLKQVPVWMMIRREKKGEPHGPPS